MGFARRELFYVGGACVIGATGLFYAIRWIRRVVKDLRNPFVPIGVVAELYIYPVKACRGRKVDMMECSELGGSNGEMNDHHFLIYNTSTNHDLEINRCPRLVIIDSDVRNGTLMLTTAEHTPIRVDLQKVIGQNKIVTVTMWDKLRQSGLDCGREVGFWLSNVLDADEPLGLLYYRDGFYTERWSQRGYRWFFGLAPVKDKIAFTAIAPYMAFASESVKDVNSHLDENHQVNSRNFRGNIVIDGCPPFDEDWWMELKIGDAEFECYQPCARCVAITVDPATGMRDEGNQPLRALRQYRLAPEGKLRNIYKQDPIFGVYMGLDRRGTIRVGDQVFARYKNKPL
ncbi:MOSC domain-containing protein 1, mitochondrial [Toxocara canis]|uniref:MOSC domain-containing protein 1, mitochondrial n=2 Tax=Toxocara canis TaxID=6265 RepID=A0A0B2V6U1_TOXCA|nr:MOSC domain-containing protein 1, mitochondrial [Toxocara canis]VDM48282.1 unnamed protein product [Toxocara canis]